MFVLTLLFLVLAAFGHVAFWVAVVNRWHATGFRRSLIKTVTLLFYAALLAPMAWGTWYVVRFDGPPLDVRDWQLRPVTFYLALCATYGAAHLAMWAIERRQARRQPQSVELGPRQIVDMVERLGTAPSGGLRTTLFGLVPGNQLWHLHVAESTISIPGLAPELDGLSICHWSDLHLSGRIDRAYFHEVVRITKRWSVDLLMLTGDVCDSADCIDWIGELFADTRTRLGKYFVLGNHDLRTGDVPRLRATLGDAGFNDLGGKAQWIDDHRIVVAGDERPWFRGEPQLPDVIGSDRQPLKILLAHTPDRFAWAQSQGFDLMLAGHTHGGQIRLPLVGAIICPSWYGARYAGGYFHKAPTLMHASRGTSSLFPLRLGCPPEITRLVLRCAKG
jgi:predicted MPP superfamily phosphohydrolase